MSVFFDFEIGGIFLIRSLINRKIKYSGEEGWLPDNSFDGEHGADAEIDSSETCLLSPSR